MTLDIAKIRAAVGFVLSDGERTFTGDGKQGFVSFPEREEFEFTGADELSDWREV